MRVSAEDFINIDAQAVPPRIMGTECEYTLVPQSPYTVKEYFYKPDSSILRTKLPHQGAYMGPEGGSGRFYIDVGEHPEDAGPECLGPAAAAQRSLQGAHIVAGMLGESVREHNGLYRTAGTFIPEEAGRTIGINASTGYHQNAITHVEVTADPLFDIVVPSSMVSRVYAMAGSLGVTGYELAQKMSGIGGAPVERDGGRRTTHGQKPVVFIPLQNMDTDVMNGSPRLKRVEVRCGDPSMSLVSEFAGLVAVSHALRLVELQRLIDAKRLANESLRSPVLAGKRFALDLSFRHKERTADGKEVTALDHQENRLEFIRDIAEEIQLPEDELLGITVIQGLIDSLRRSKPGALEYDKEARMRVGFAIRHQYIAAGKDVQRVTAVDAHALHRNLEWDRVQPAGPGFTYWQRMNAMDPLAQQITALANASGLAGRAKRRAAMAETQYSKPRVHNWSTYSVPGGNLKTFGNPYQE